MQRAIRESGALIVVLSKASLASNWCNKVETCRKLQGPLDGAEALDSNDRLEAVLQAAALPVEAGALAEIEVGNLHFPTCVGMLARNEAGERALTYSPF